MISPDFVLDLILVVWSIAVAVKDCWAKNGSGDGDDAASFVEDDSVCCCF